MFCVRPPSPPEAVALSDFIRRPYWVPLKEQLMTMRLETPPEVLPPMETPWPVPKLQLVTTVSEDVPAVLPSAMLSSPSLIEEFSTRQFVPIRSMPSVLGEKPGALIVIPWTVTLPVVLLNTICMEGEFSKVAF